MRRWIPFLILTGLALASTRTQVYFGALTSHTLSGPAAACTSAWYRTDTCRTIALQWRQWTQHYDTDSAVVSWYVQRTNDTTALPAAAVLHAANTSARADTTGRATTFVRDFTPSPARWSRYIAIGDADNSTLTALGYVYLLADITPLGIHQ